MHCLLHCRFERQRCDISCDARNISGLSFKIAAGTPKNSRGCFVYSITTETAGNTNFIDDIISIPDHLRDERTLSCLNLPPT